MKFYNVIKKTSLAVLAAGLLAGAVSVNVPYTAVNAGAESLTAFAMVGAEIRPDNAATPDKDETGIRFISRVDKTAYAGLGAVTEAGTLLIPRKILGDDELVRGYADAVDLSTLGKYVDGGDYYEFRAALYGIPENSYLSGIVARSYIVANGTTYYTDEIERSVSWVANRALEEHAYDATTLPILRDFQTVTADTELKINYTAGYPVRNSEPVAKFTEEGETLSMEFTVLEDLDDSKATSLKRLYFGVNSGAGTNMGQTNGSNIFFDTTSVSYQAAGSATSSSFESSSFNVYKLFTAGNRVKAEYTYQDPAYDGANTFAVYVKTPTDSDYVVAGKRIGVPLVNNAYMGLWDLNGGYTTVFNDLTYKHNGVQTENLKFVALNTQGLNVNRVYGKDDISVAFTGGNAHISVGISDIGRNVFDLDYNQTLVWEFDITQASMNSRIGFFVSESARLGNGDYSDGPRLHTSYSTAMLEYQIGATDSWSGTDATPQANRNCNNIFRAGFCYKIEYKTPTSATANDGSLIIWEKAKTDKSYITVRELRNIKTSVAGAKGAYAPMTGVKFSIMVVGVSTETSFTMKNSQCYVVETGERVRGYTSAGKVTIN